MHICSRLRHMMNSEDEGKEIESQYQSKMLESNTKKKRYEQGMPRHSASLASAQHCKLNVPLVCRVLHIVLWLAEAQSLWVLISPLMSRRGGVPNWRRYSRLNCEGLSYPT